MAAKKPPVNDEFTVEALAAKEKAAAAKVKIAKVIDPEDDKKNWPTIHVEMEEGKPNYEYLSVHGTKKDGKPFGHDLQLMRGVDVKVPPSVVHMLREAISAHYLQRRDPVSGRMQMIRQDRSSVPWRLVKGGKYIR